MKTLRTLFLAELAGRHGSEQQQVIGLLKIAQSATCQHLQKLLLEHHEETTGQVEKLGLIFKTLDEELRVSVCEITADLLGACEDVVAEHLGSPTLNAALIASVQKIEHQEIASYGCLLEWAELLENKETIGTLEELLDQEQTANQSLIELARLSCNKESQDDTPKIGSTCDRFGHEVDQPAPEAAADHIPG